MDALLKDGYTVMLETGGHVSVERVPKGVIKIIDVKTPGSREGNTFRPENLDLAAPHDEYKFVITSRADYEWSRDFLFKELRDRANPGLVLPFP
jgi:7-carboxy-7-deazaguanine synthase